MKEHFALLLFPDKVHQRSPDPGPFTDHRSYKAALQKEFQRKCVYCRISDGLKGYGICLPYRSFVPCQGNLVPLDAWFEKR